MPLIPSAMKNFVLAKAISLIIAGEKMPDFTDAVSKATCSYVLASSTSITTNIALGPGGGTGTGRVVGLIPSIMSVMMRTKAISMGLWGKDSKKLFDSISFGVVQAMNTVIVQGTVIGAGIGSGTGKIMGLIPSVLEGSIMAQMASKRMLGERTKQLISAVAFGICNHIMSAGMIVQTDIGFVLPPPVIPIMMPATGTSRLT